MKSIGIMILFTALLVPHGCDNRAQMEQQSALINSQAGQISELRERIDKQDQETKALTERLDSVRFDSGELNVFKTSLLSRFDGIEEKILSIQSRLDALGSEELTQQTYLDLGSKQFHVARTRIGSSTSFSL